MSRLSVMLVCITIVLALAACACAQDMQLAVLSGDLAKVKLLVGKDPSLVNAKDDNGLTPLHYAITANHTEIAKFLIANKADINAKAPGGMPLICMAASVENESLVDLLLAQGADINARFGDGSTILHIAVMSDKRKLAAFLVSKGADPNAKDKSGVSPLSMAKEFGRAQMLEILTGKRKASEITDAPDPQPKDDLYRPQPRHSGSGPAKPAVSEIKHTVRKAGAPGTKAVTYAKQVVRGCPVNVITVDLNDFRVKVDAAVSRGGIGTDETFSSFIQRYKPVAAINGAYFSKTNLKPIGDIVINGALINFGAMGSGVCFTSDSQAGFITVERHRRYDWSEFKTVICCGPRLLSKGQIVVDAPSEGFRDPHVMGNASRTGVGLTAANKLILANTTKGVSFAEWAAIMKALGCVEAVNMDAGASLGMYYRGKMISSPGRRLTNVLLVYENQ